MIINTTEDGWDCVPELKEVTKAIDNMGSHIYEIKNCVRSSHLDNLVLEMKEMLEEALDLIKKIDIDREFETVDCNNCDEMELYGDEECPDCGREAE